jgi:hypothetical protein
MTELQDEIPAHCLHRLKLNVANLLGITLAIIVAASLQGAELVAQSTTQVEPETPLSRGFLERFLEFTRRFGLPSATEQTLSGPPDVPVAAGAHIDSAARSFRELQPLPAVAGYPTEAESQLATRPQRRLLLDSATNHLEAQAAHWERLVEQETNIATVKGHTQSIITSIKAELERPRPRSPLNTQENPSLELSMPRFVVDTYVVGGDTVVRRLLVIRQPSSMSKFLGTDSSGFFAKWWQDVKRQWHELILVIELYDFQQADYREEKATQNYRRNLRRTLLAHHLAREQRFAECLRRRTPCVEEWVEEQREEIQPAALRKYVARLEPLGGVALAASELINKARRERQDQLYNRTNNVLLSLKGELKGLAEETALLENERKRLADSSAILELELSRLQASDTSLGRLRAALKQHDLKREEMLIEVARLEDDLYKFGAELEPTRSLASGASFQCPDPQLSFHQCPENAAKQVYREQMRQAQLHYLGLSHKIEEVRDSVIGHLARMRDVAAEVSQARQQVLAQELTLAQDRGAFYGRRTLQAKALSLWRADLSRNATELSANRDNAARITLIRKRTRTGD